jgi:hypothetical protein
MSSGLEGLGGVEISVSSESAEEGPRKVIEALVSKFKSLFESVDLEYVLDKEEFRVVSQFKSRWESLIIARILANSYEQEMFLLSRATISLVKFWDEEARDLFKNKLGWKHGMPSLQEVEELLKKVRVLK